METVSIHCPNTKCAKKLRLSLDPSKSERKCRCPACQTLFAITLAPPKPALPDEDDPGLAPLELSRKPTQEDLEDDGVGYGMAAESSLSYLLRRECDGFKLSDEEKATKKRLLAEKLQANPRECPYCQLKIQKGAAFCPSCKLDIAKGRLPKPEKPEEEIVPDKNAPHKAAAVAAAAEIILTILS